MEYITVLDFDDGKVYQYENLDHFKDGWNENKEDDIDCEHTRYAKKLERFCLDCGKHLNV